MKNEGLLSTLRRANVRDFRPVVFWSINSELGEEELCRQIGEMKSFGLGGFIFHAMKEMLVGGIMSNLSGMFDSVNQQVADISVHRLRKAFA